MLLMLKSRFTIESSAFVILCFISLFGFSRNMTDSFILPKWYFTIAFFGAGSVVLSLKFLCSGNVSFKVSILAFGIVIACVSQAFYGIVQSFSCFIFNKDYLVVGSYDNSAGFAASLCMSIPFFYCVRKKRK